MSGDSDSDKNIEKLEKPDKTECRLDNPDANKAREADKEAITEAGKLNPDNWMSAEGQFAIVDENQVLASRDVSVESSKQTNIDFDKQNLSEELEAIKDYGDSDQAQLAEQIQAMRTATKEKGLATTEIDQFAKETFSTRDQEGQYKQGAFKPLDPTDIPAGGFEQENRADGGVTLIAEITGGEVQAEKSLDGQDKVTDSVSVPPERLKAVDHATTYLLSETARLHGKDKVDALNIDKSDVGRALGSYLLTPDIANAVGEADTRRFGQMLMVFGLAPAFGLADETQKQISEKTQETVHDGSANFLTGTAFGAILEGHPAVAFSIGAVMTTTFLHEQLFSPENKARNEKVLDLYSKTGNSGPEELITFCDKSKELLGPEAYKASFDLATGGVGIPHGHVASRGIKTDGGNFDISAMTKSVAERLKQLPDQAIGFINEIVGHEPVLQPADGPPLSKQHFPITPEENENSLFMSVADNLEGKGAKKGRSHIEGELVEGIHYKIHESTGRIQRTDLGEIRQPYRWPVWNERIAPDIVRQAEGDSCVAKIGEILSGGTKTEQDLITKIGTDTDLDLLPSKLGNDWTSAKGPMTLGEIGKNGPWGAELQEGPWTKHPKNWHMVIVEGPSAEGNVAILDPLEATRYEMTIDNFKAAWTGRCVYRKSK